MADTTKALGEALAKFRNETLIPVMQGMRLKDKYGQLWDIRAAVFSADRTILRLGLGTTENYRAIVIYNDDSDLTDYELVPKTEDNI